MTATTEIKKRSQIEQSDKWNAEALFASPAKWGEQFGTFSWEKLLQFRGRLGEGSSVLQEALEALFAASRELEKLHTYAHMRHDEETTADNFKSDYQKIMAKYAQFQQESAWFDPELLALPKETIESYLQSEELKPYRFYLEKVVRMQPHTLDQKGEHLLALSAQSLRAPSNAFSSLNNADMKFDAVKDEKGEKKELTHGLYALYLRSTDRTLRKNAFEQMYSKFGSMENTLSDLLAGQVEGHIFSARARNFPSALDAALFAKNIPTAVYETLISSVRANLPVLHRYMDVRKRVMGVDELHLYDTYVPLAADVDIQMDYETAQNLVIESVAPLGEEYQTALERGLKQERWVDRYENENKRSGAYSTGCFDSFPFILMNYRGILRDVFTLAHEAGHSMHSYLSHKNQPYHDSHYPIFVAEVASTFNEELLMHLMLERTTEKRKRFYLINEKLEDLRATFFRQTMFAEFELQIHRWVEEGTPLTPSLLKEYYHQLNVDYFGPSVVIDEAIAIEWARIPHFYYNFYVYQYATGISAALALCEKVLSGDESARRNYLSFLQGGGSLFPIDLLKMAGVDMSCSQPVEATVRTFDHHLSELEKLI
ncbi:MAG: Oligoendopeptidase F, plasmid [Chlamydiales bacterium]|nr:Oligoendopeptidase F, plasmid [Chlamydiales bacterium]MCH9634909.1 Oligoendopeptidase F, plasmid [Chlamydiales bacterium]MCH9704121.1 oligoendopeptidase F [Chlamydiota bacterium]